MSLQKFTIILLAFKYQNQINKNRVHNQDC